jgi:hypothetical protein
MDMRRIWQDLWQPPGQALDAFASVLSEHWRAASDRTSRLFWSTPRGWLRAPGPRTPDPAASAHHFTSGGRLIK